MKKFLELLVGKEPPPEELSDYWKKIVTFMMIFSAMIAFISMLITNIITNENQQFIFINLAGIFSTIICLVLLRGTKKRELFTHVFLVLYIIGSLIVFMTVDPPRYEHFGAFYIPVITTFMYSKKKRVLIPAAYYLIILVLESVYGFFGIKFFIQYSLYYCVLTFFLFIIAYSRTRTQEILEVTEKEKAIYDSQTMLYSKTYMIRIMEETIMNESFFLMMFDIDNFKNINDTKGHVYGDECIERLAEVLQSVNKNSFCGRFGGDEFLVIRPYKKICDIKEKAIKIHTEVSEKISDFGITVSAGVVNKTKNEQPVKLIYYADTALYEAKGDGKNCVRVYGEDD